MVARIQRACGNSALLLALCGLLSACQTLAGQPPRLFSLEGENALVRSRVAAAESAYYESASARNETMRNEIIASRMQAIDVNYYEYEAAILREKQEAGFISSIVNIGLTGAIPLVAPVGTKDILGGISSGLQGANKAFGDEVLFRQTVQALQQQMRANRATVAARIVDRMRTLDIAAYPLPMAIGDVEEYYSAGTIAGALIEINRTVGEEAKKAQGIKNAVVRGTFGFDDSGLVLTAYLVPGGEPNQDRIRRINACVGGGVNVMTHIGALTNSRSIDIRRRAVACVRRQPDFLQT